MMNPLDMIAGKRGPSENTSLTPEENAQLEQQIAKDEQALARAEQQVKKLPPGHQVYSCPGCHMTWTGPFKGQAWKGWQSHTSRHAHAKNPTNQGLERR